MRKVLTIIFILIIPLVLYLAINFKGQRNSKNKNNTSDTGYRNLRYELYKDGGIIIYPSSNNSYSKLYIKAAENFRENFRWSKFKILPDTGITLNELKNNSLILIGTYKSNLMLRKITKKIPVIFNRNGFEFHNKFYYESTALVTMFYANPYNKNKALFIISGNNDKYVATHINQRMIGDIRITVNDKCDAMDLLKQNKFGNWIPDSNSYRNFSSMKKTYTFSPNYKYVVYSKNITRDEVKKIDRKFGESINNMKQFFGNKFLFYKTNYYLFDNFEDKGLIVYDTHLENVNWDDSSIQSVDNSWIHGTDFFSNALLLIRQNLGNSKSDFLERGLAIHFSKNWREKGYKFWAAFLAEAGNIPSLKELFNNKMLPFISGIIADPLAGSFVDFLLNKYGKDRFLSLYTNWKPGEFESINLQKEWRKYLKELAKKFKDEILEYKNKFPGSIPVFQKGFCFAHEGYDIYNGYLSMDAVNSLKKLKSLGVNSFSITPFTSMRNVNEPISLRFWQFPGAENDESIIFLSHVSKKLNMTVMLKPHIYLGRNGWPGDIKMKNKKDWDLFFHYYFNWIEHYAMLAEMYKIPMLCIGNELAGATDGHKKEWVSIISKIRKLYDGKMTYGANWSEEYKHITFWNLLDYIGISEYYPLSKGNNPTNKELLTGARGVIKKISRISGEYNKQVIFTEVGFRSTPAPWKSVYETTGKDKINLSSQARCYNALFEAAYNEPWLAGMYWWKWPSYLSFGNGADNNMYTPNNKPAQKIVKKWYSKKWN